MANLLAPLFRGSRASFALLALTLAACGGDSGTSPTPTPTANVAGTWRFSWNSLNGTFQGTFVQCSAQLNMSLTQTANTFSGTQAAPLGRLTCSAGGVQVLDEPIGGETLVNGQINGTAISFRLGTVNGPHNGTIAGTSMSGNGTWNIPQTVGGVLVLNGEWTAVKL